MNISPDIHALPAPLQVMPYIMNIWQCAINLSHPAPEGGTFQDHLNQNMFPLKTLEVEDPNAMGCRMFPRSQRRLLRKYNAVELTS